MGDRVILIIANDDELSMDVDKSVHLLLDLGHVIHYHFYNFEHVAHDLGEKVLLGFNHFQLDHEFLQIL